MNIVILAAGMGKRMNSDLPKVLHPLAGRPLLGHVIDTARSLAPRRLVIVTGHGSEAVRAAFADEAGREAHLQGAIAAALMANAAALLSTPPVIEKIDLLAAKLPG